jgi:hypothetical protein
MDLKYIQHIRSVHYPALPKRIQIGMKNVPHTVDTEGQVPYEKGGSLRGPPSLGRLPAVGEGLHRGPLGWGDEGQSVSTGGDGTLPERVR